MLVEGNEFSHYQFKEKLSFDQKGKVLGALSSFNLFP
jgi:hypothetical protein